MRKRLNFSEAVYKSAQPSSIFGSHLNKSRSRLYDLRSGLQLSETICNFRKPSIKLAQPSLQPAEAFAFFGSDLKKREMKFKNKVAN